MGEYKEDTWSRIFERKEDVRFLLDKSKEEMDENLEALKVRIKNEDSARRIGISVHPDLSITAEFPETGATGWILTRDRKETRKKFENALEFLGNSIKG